MKIEEVIKQLESILAHVCSMAASPDADDIWKKDIDALEFAITALRSMQETTKPGWISVKERLPNFGIPVLICWDGYTEEHKELTAQLRRMSVETGSLMCLGCGYEHNCGIHGCALLRQAVETIERQAAALEDLRDHECSGLVEERDNRNQRREGRGRAENAGAGENPAGKIS